MTESTPITAPAGTFASVAERVQRRVLVRRWLALLGASWIPVAVVMLLLAMAAVLKVTGTPWLGLALLLGWTCGTLAWTWWTRPGPYSALALWDEAAGRREAFANAWWFERQPQRTQQEEAHVQTQSRMLDGALPRLPGELPLRVHRWLWVPFVLAIATGLADASRQLADREDPLGADALRAASEEAKRLDADGLDKKKLSGLTEQEKKDLEKLKQDLKQTARDLENSSGKTANEVLSSLEKRARDAEKLAQQLGADKDAWASDALVDELRKHADTADLGDAVAARKAAQASKAAEELSKLLKSPQLSNDAQQRMKETLDQVEKVAEKDDRQRTVGSHVLNAGDQMDATKPREAGEEFEKLADKMRELAQREKTREELEKLAQQLRNAGSNITGQSGGSMQQMAGSGEQGQQGQTPQVSQAPSGQQMMNPQSMGSGSQLPPPGLGQQGQGQQSQQMMNPVPGSGQGQQMQLTMGQGQKGKQDGKPTLMAPVPGAKPGEKPDALVLGQQGPENPDGPSILLNMPGGNQPGVGTAKLDAEATQKQGAPKQSVVTANSTNEGTSTVRSVEGGARKEQAGRSASQIAVDFIQAEEAALDDVSLPPSRREQVRRYFTELRKRFEKQ